MFLAEVHQKLVNVGPLFPVDFDAYEIPVQKVSRFRIGEGPGSHHMTPVAGGIARGNQQQFVLADRMVEDPAVPLLPPDGIPGMLKQVRRCRPVKIVAVETDPRAGFPLHLPSFPSHVTETMISFLRPIP